MPSCPPHSAVPVTVFGQTVDDQTRCVHYRSAVDVIAIQFHCCLRFYPCYRCHAEAETHPASQWPEARFDHPAILCGVCHETLSIRLYQSVHACPACAAPFNDACALHAPLYFAVPAGEYPAVTPGGAL